MTFKPLFPLPLFKLSITALSLTAGLSTVSAAESSDNIERIETTSSRIVGNENNVGYIVSSITEDTLDLLSFQHIQESLNYIAGAGVQRGNGQEYLPALRSPVLTGAGACGGILAAEDGIPLRAAGFCNINELFEAHGEMAQRIDVIKGPASALYGSNAIHGVINVVTPDTTRGGGVVGLDYGSYGFHRVKLRQGKDFGDSGIGINASITRDTGYRNDEGVDQEKVNIRHRADFDNVSITSGVTYTNLDQETAGYITGFESYKDKQVARSNPNPEAFRKARSLRIWSKVDWLFDNNSALSITPYVRDQSMDFRMHFLPGKPLEQNAQEGVGVLTQYNHIMSPSLNIDVGLDAEYTQGELMQSQDSETVGSAFLVETVPQGKHYDYNVDATLLAPFFAVNLQQGAWDISIGGRFESMRYDYTNNMNVGRLTEDGSECGFGGCRYSRPESGKNDFDNFSPKLSMQYALSDTTRFYGGIAKGYRAPQATELYRLQRAQQVTDLDAVDATNIEVGVRGEIADGSYVLSLYSLEKDNVIYRDSDFFNVSNGETWHRGVELTFNYAINSRLRIDFAGSYSAHTYEHDQLSGEVNIKGNDMDTAPDWLVNTRLQYLLTDAIETQLEWQHVASYFTDPENANEYEGHNLFHARASYAVSDNMTLYARINNLLDETYAERADFTSFTGARYFPGRPRNFMLSATFTM
ncbi:MULTISPECIES: TonB-dependent receptor family protein [unclassified Alteromonas]|uniref:TonB-dependent receptor family protein n=1 Tax=unclassified Alteromonas TaxID=2614992 RepID=UPI000509FEBD|nr:MULTISPECIES: TonB-dependent receptor [unclassified Alteromonas]